MKYSVYERVFSPSSQPPRQKIGLLCVVAVKAAGKCADFLEILAASTTRRLLWPVFCQGGSTFFCIFTEQNRYPI